MTPSGPSPPATHPPRTSLTRPSPPQAKLRNNHLSYAVTWFSLAAVLVAIAGLYLRGQMKKTIA